jgi:hypothetical protein
MATATTEETGTLRHYEPTFASSPFTLMRRLSGEMDRTTHVSAPTAPSTASSRCPRA